MVEIDGFPEYFVDKNGIIYSKKVWRCNKSGTIRIIKPFIDRKGYLVVSIRDSNGKKKNCFVHRIVAKAFIPNPNNYPHVNHKNRNTKDNHVDNLEWCTLEQNNKYTFTIGNKMNGVACELFKNGILIGSFCSMNEAANYAVEKYNVDKNHLLNFLEFEDVNIIRTGNPLIRTWYLFHGNEIEREFKYFKDVTNYVSEKYLCSINSKKRFSVKNRLFVTDDKSYDVQSFWRQKLSNDYSYSNSNLSKWILYKDGNQISTFTGLSQVIDYLKANYPELNIRQLIRTKETQMFRLEKEDWLA